MGKTNSRCYLPCTQTSRLSSSQQTLWESNPEASYTKEVNEHVLSGFCMYSKFAYGEVENLLKFHRGEDCVEQFCDYIENETKRLYHMFPEMPMKPLTREEWK